MVIKPSSLVTLKAVASFATALFRLRGILFVLAAVAAVWFVLSLTNPNVTSARALLPLALGLWVALGLGVAYTLTRAPPRIEPRDSLSRRVRKRIGQLGYGVALAGVLTLAGIAILFSIRAIDLATS